MISSTRLWSILILLGLALTANAHASETPSPAPDAASTQSSTESSAPRSTVSQDSTAQSSSAPLPSPAERVAFAIVIGNNQSLGRRRPELRYADDDAARYFEIFQTLAPGRVSLLSEFDRDTERLFPEAHRHAMKPAHRNLQNVGKRLARDVQAARAAGHETELYFVFAGHGDVDQGEGFIELSDARFRSSELEAFLRAIPFTRAHVILDSCNSFFMLGVRKPGGRHFATSADAARALAARLPNVGVFLSTSAEGEAFEWSEIQSGIFSHVVRSGLLGAADADADGSISYLELAAFVDTATAEVRNPNMRPQVFSRGPGASEHTPIVRLHSMNFVRRIELTEAKPLRIRLRDASGLPLLDAHVEPNRRLQLQLPEAWARGAVLERSDGGSDPAAAWRKFYSIPEASDVVTSAALQESSPQSGVRGPDETFRTLFAQPFGPRAMASYLERRSSAPTPIYGVTQEDAQRMGLLLNELSRFERGRRIQDGIGGLGVGTLMTGAGIGVLQYDRDLSSQEKTEAKITGGVLLGLGGLFLIGGGSSLFATSASEKTAAEFRHAIQSGVEPARAFARADERLRELVKERRNERLAAAFIGSVIILGSAGGLVWSELSSDGSGNRMAPRLGWGGGIVGGVLLIGEGLLTETPVDTITKLWRDDPSLNQYQTEAAPDPVTKLWRDDTSKIQYQPVVSVTEDGAFFGLFGVF